MRLEGKKIILGITGSIAAYKAAVLLRFLVKEGAEVQVIITPSGKEFITPLTLSVLSGKQVLSDFFAEKSGNWNSHVDLGLWADLMLIAPATATTMAKMAMGLADNLLVTTYLSARCPVFIAPAMDLDMFAHPATKRNMEMLLERGIKIIEPGVGKLASGLSGKGRMEEPEKILETVVNHFSENQMLFGKSFLVTAGPTFEKIDPVRFIGNFSSGKMGYSIAEELAKNGAVVHLVSGPVAITAKHKNINLIQVESAAEMLEQCVGIFPQTDGAVMCAAVADYTPVVFEKEKKKRESDIIAIELKPTEDIAGKLGKIKKDNQILIGFALETTDEIKNATAKLNKKNLDFIVLNSLKDKGAGFQFDTNKITIIGKDNNRQFYELKSKREVAVDIVEKIKTLIH